MQLFLQALNTGSEAGQSAPYMHVSEVQQIVSQTLDTLQLHARHMGQVATTRRSTE